MESSKWITDFIYSNHEMTDKNKTFKFIKIQRNNKRNHEPYFSLPFINEDEQQIKGILNYSSINLGSQESMNELNKRYRKKMHSMNDDYTPFSWDIFRANIIINGCPTPHFEDFCKVLIINNKVELLWNRRRYFCSVPNVDQSNGSIGTYAELIDIIYNNHNNYSLFTSILEGIPHTYPHLCIGGVNDIINSRINTKYL
eukprot:167607_1